MFKCTLVGVLKTQFCVKLPIPSTCLPFTSIIHNPTVANAFFLWCMCHHDWHMLWFWMFNYCQFACYEDIHLPVVHIEHDVACTCCCVTWCVMLFVDWTVAFCITQLLWDVHSKSYRSSNKVRFTSILMQAWCDHKHVHNSRMVVLATLRSTYLLVRNY